MIMWYPCFCLQMHRCVQLLRWLFYCCMRWCTLSLALASSIYSSLYMALALPPLPIFLSPKIWDFWLLPMHVTYIFFEKKKQYEGSSRYWTVCSLVLQALHLACFYTCLDKQHLYYPCVPLLALPPLHMLLSPTIGYNIPLTSSLFIGSCIPNRKFIPFPFRL